MLIAIIGAGASGMAAAIAASENPDAQIILLERQSRVGRKLSATGNGRCNLTNRTANPERYHGDVPTFPVAALNRFPVEETLDWFRDMGLYTVEEPGGRIYPFSDQANSVVDILRFALNRNNIRLETGFEVEKVRRTPEGFHIEGTGGSLDCQRLIVACGGLAGTKLGGSMSGYKILRSLGHRCTRLRPALVQLKSDWRGCASLKGVRTDCRAAILHNGIRMAESAGELQFTEYGLSGPVIFEISRDACQAPGTWSCVLDLLPPLEEASLFSILLRRKATSLTAEDLLTGILHNRLGRVLVQTAGISLHIPIAELSEDHLKEVAAMVKRLEISLTEPMGMDTAQVTAGGIRTEEFDPCTMESRLVPGLYACGEVLDVDGDCGGFNLQWAWSSGRLAGTCAGGEKS